MWETQSHWESQPNWKTQPQWETQALCSGMSIFALGFGIYLSNFSNSGQDAVNATCEVAAVGPSIKVMSALEVRTFAGRVIVNCVG